MWKRKCPSCHKIVYVKHKRSYKLGIKYNRNCGTCNRQICGSSPIARKKIGNANRGSKNGMYGKHAVNYGKKDSSETIRKKQLAMRGKKNPFYNHKHTDESKKKIRLAIIKSLQERCGGGICPKYNPIACQIIDKYGQTRGYNFQHALNGGEFYIKELGYWVDGYDKQKNVVIEYYEKCHRRTKEKIRDKKRINEIINLLGCRVVILKEWDKNPTVIN